MKAHKINDTTVLNRRPYISDQAAQLVKKIKEKSVSEFASEGEVIEFALRLLWNHEKSKAFSILNKKEADFYAAHPEEKDFLATVQGVKG
jgi:hypothetical protein